MNRNNIWIHVTVAVVAITFAAVLGQIRRWESGLRAVDSTPPEIEVSERPEHDAAPEVLVKFKPGVSLQRIRALASLNNDRVDDEIEAVNGLVFLDDMDDASVESVVAQYRGRADVEYAEANVRIELDDPNPIAAEDLLDRGGINAKPNDPNFDEQWSLNNVGQDGGKQNADISALKAWATTRGSEEVVVAVLDSGVD